ncbi:type II toxin-antitoxin system HicB family antitoxin [Patescibacteria group bacterium]|nr:type II toxin-antitoxin system HicB family antitoxin [Patescibacteria group bacterium]MBU4512397.1 type II toxin-antitoxin system HicB family antitoxin [Patescibacteria group bacterium]MCG2692971.1 type II toxin-antitoxin system HicB family antitoxin [Candidatus Parcubacteria bacterium]
MKKAKKNYQFPVFIQKNEDGYYFIECPIFKSCYTQGKSVEKALDNIKEVIELCLEEEESQEIIKHYKPQNFGLYTLNTQVYA